MKTELASQLREVEMAALVKERDWQASLDRLEEEKGELQRNNG